MKWTIPLALGLSILLALILRVPDLDQRPFHNDEAVNALKFRGLYEEGDYRYDPHEYHGPALHYATLGLARLTGWPSFEETTEADFRWVPLLAGLSLIPLLGLTRDALGTGGTAVAAVLTAVSPSLVFFSRDYIHEMLLVACTFLLVGSLWRYGQRPHWGWALGAGLALGCMQATKETFVFNLAAMALAGASLAMWPGSGAARAVPSRNRLLTHGGLLLVAWGGVWLLFFSSFGRNPGGLLDSVMTYRPWLSRAGGDSPHVHPFWFYGERLFWQPSGAGWPWTELGLLGLAGVGWVTALRRPGGVGAPFVRWLGFYSLFLFLIYSVIPYKTPWCILSVSHGLVLLAGAGAAALWRMTRSLPRRAVLAVVTGTVLIHTTWQAWALSHSQGTSRRNPWAYADTAPDIRNLIRRVERLGAVSPQGMKLNVQVVSAEDDYWPLPYALRRFERVGWWSELPPLPLAPVVIVATRPAGQWDGASTHINTGTFQLRHGVFLTCYVERRLWEDFLAVPRSD